jgi:hypothetical protein|tara:strand:- start:281 stop:547 length:267 start_codon:yes stop_codon:yes gene_type:complete
MSTEDSKFLGDRYSDWNEFLSYFLKVGMVAKHLEKNNSVEADDEYYFHLIELWDSKEIIKDNIHMYFEDIVVFQNDRKHNNITKVRTV